MDEKLTKRLLTIAGLSLAGAAILFLFAAIFGEARNWAISSAFICVMLSNLFHFIRYQAEKNER